MDRFDCGLIELKLAGSSAEDMTFTGYGAVFGNVDSYGDVIAKGAFAATLAESKASGNMPAMLLQHGGAGLTAQDMTPIGVWKSLQEDDTGLLVEGKLAPTPRGQEVHALMKMGAFNGLSIGYIPDPSGTKRGDGKTSPLRTLSKLRLLEISPVTFPANGKARVSSVKSIDDLETLADCERALRELGMSKSDAVALVSRIKKFCRSDSDGGDRSESGLAEIAAALRVRATKLPH
jgi:HK97 family phage prohead protease